MAEQILEDVVQSDAEREALYQEMLHDIRVRKQFRVAPSDSGPKVVFLECHYCGYSATDGLPESGACPKCGGSSWERFALSRRLVPATMQDTTERRLAV
jgi:rubrerythrin